jgi:Skp family chaperone for outer membrane proteins
MNAQFLQIFLLINIFLIGVVTALAIQHAFAHFRPHPPEAGKPRPTPQNAHLPFEVRKHLLEAAQTHFEAVLDHSATELQHDLTTTAAQINKQLERLGTEIVNDEMKRYRTSLDDLRKQTEATISNSQAEIAEHQSGLQAQLAQRQTELEAKLVEEMVAEKQQLTQQIDTKLADAVASFLIETMQHNVDLGAQSTYLTTMLEEHKTELTKGIIDEA